MALKIKKHHLEEMGEAINKYINSHSEVIEQYQTGNFPRSDSTKDLNRRFRWDMARAAGLEDFINGLYGYLDDQHIDSALRAVTPMLVKQY